MSCLAERETGPQCLNSWTPTTLCTLSTHGLQTSGAWCRARLPVSRHLALLCVTDTGRPLRVPVGVHCSIPGCFSNLSPMPGLWNFKADYNPNLNSTSKVQQTSEITFLAQFTILHKVITNLLCIILMEIHCP